MSHQWNTIVLASRNKHKIGELRAILQPLGIELKSALDFPELAEVEETGATFEENAALKAEAVCKALGLPALADDSGLMVDALGGEPGVRSARYSGAQATDSTNNALLLQKLADTPDAARTARFVCVLAFSAPGEITHFYRGETFGIMLRAPRGENGFGYDPLFLSDDLAKTFAEAPAEEKNRISHRGRALERFRNDLLASIKG